MSCSVELYHSKRQQGMVEDPHKIAAMMNKSQRLVLGLTVLLLVDIIWVSSSELTKVCYFLFICFIFFYIWKIDIIAFVKYLLFFSTYIKKLHLISHSLAHILKHQCLHCTYLAYASGHHGESSILNQQITWYAVNIKF